MRPGRLDAFGAKLSGNGAKRRSNGAAVAGSVEEEPGPGMGRLLGAMDGGVLDGFRKPL